MKKKMRVTKVVKIKRAKLVKILFQLQEAVKDLENLDFDIPSKNDRYDLSDTLAALHDVESDLDKVMGVK